MRSAIAPTCNRPNALKLRYDQALDEIGTLRSLIVRRIGQEKSMQKKLDASAGLFAVVGMKAELSIRVNAAISYLLGAARFSRMVGKIEGDNASSPFGDFWEEMRDLATACVFFVDAAVESYANEIFADRARLFSDSTEDLDRRWDKLERRNSFTKLNVALKLRRKPPLDPRTNFAKNYTLLIVSGMNWFTSSRSGRMSTRGTWRPPSFWRGSLLGAPGFKNNRYFPRHG